MICRHSVSLISSFEFFKIKLMASGMFSRTVLCGLRSRTVSTQFIPIITKCTVRARTVKFITLPQFSHGYTIVRQLSVKTMLFHKTYVENENHNARELMEKLGTYSLHREDFLGAGLISQGEFIDLTKRDWSELHPNELLVCFKQLSEYSGQNNICITEKVFDEFIDAFTDSLKHLSDEQLEEVFWFLKMWPEVKSPHVRNYAEIWVGLDDVLCSRMLGWNIDKMLLFGDYFCFLNLGRKVEYMFYLLSRAVRRSKYLHPHQFVQTMFYVGIRRSPNLQLQSMQDRYAIIFDKLTTDEHSIISMALFKTQCRIKDHVVLNKLISRVIDDVDIISDVHLTAFLKVIRYSYKNVNSELVTLLLNSLSERITKLSFMSCTHTALLCQKCRVYDEEVLSKIFKKLQQNPKEARLKDLERLALTYGSLHASKAVSVYHIILNELRSPEREPELLQYGRAFACCLFYLVSHVVPDRELIAKVLDENFLLNIYGKDPYLYGREILSLDNTIDIEVKDYNGNRLNEKSNKLLVKKYLVKPPRIYPDYKPRDHLKRLYVDIMSLMKKIRGEYFVTCVHLVPHFSYADVLVGDDSNGNPLTTDSIFDIASIENYKVKRKPIEGTWFALIPTEKFGIDEYSSSTTYSKTKTRQLEMLGYKPIWVVGDDWRKLKSEAEMIDHLNEKMYGKSVEYNLKPNDDHLSTFSKEENQAVI